MVAEPEVSAPVSAVAELSPEVVALVAEPEVFALVSAAVEPSPEVAALTAEPEVAFVVVVFLADVAEPWASVDIAVAFAVLAPVSVSVVEFDSSGRPKFLAFPIADYFASSSSFVEVVGRESVHSSTCGHANYDLYSILSNLGLHQNRTWGRYHNNATRGHNNVNGTSGLPIDATTNHSRKRGLHQCKDRRKHTCPVSRSPLAVGQIRWAVAEKFQYLYLPLPSLE